MSSYFPAAESLDRAQHGDMSRELRTIAGRYMGDNPVTPPVFRISLASGFRRQADYRYVFDLEQRFPEAGREQAVYAWGRIYFPAATDACFKANAIGPMTVWLNGQVIYHSNYEEERDAARARRFFINVPAGWSDVVIEFIRTPLGFGGIFGTGRFKNFPFHFMMPLPDTQGWEGWVYTRPQQRVDVEHIDDYRSLPSDGHWLPERSYAMPEAGEDAQTFGPALNRLYGDRLSRGRAAWGWTRARLRSGELHVQGHARSELKLLVSLVGEADEAKQVSLSAGDVDIHIPVAGGEHDLRVQAAGHEDGWGCELTFTQDGHPAPLQNPAHVVGYRGAWLYLGPAALQAMIQPDLTLVQQETYWQVDVPQGFIRPFLENDRFGKWNYPLGVTLYGMLMCAREIGAEDMKAYIRQHVNLAVSYYDYALWDKERYGAAAIDNQISNVDSLDDCGSFASLMLELGREGHVPGSREIAAATAHYIEHEQARLDDGTLVRGQASLAEMAGTMWADDLYMSVPFLSRYYELTGDTAYIDDAARQYLNFRKYLFIPEQKIMSHVYLTDRGIANHIPWGRGNGWVLFSLSELLRVMPHDHEARATLLEFFRTLCEGYLALQDTDGMWHQVLTDPTSYQEASCTAMFVSAFARGVRHGWLTDDVESYIQAVERGWHGLSELAVDSHGAVYGICQGSGYSFRSTYYRDELTWVLNDPHGIGIVLMAGSETMRLRDYLAEG